MSLCLRMLRYQDFVIFTKNKRKILIDIYTHDIHDMLCQAYFIHMSRMYIRLRCAARIFRGNLADRNLGTLRMTFNIEISIGKLKLQEQIYHESALAMHGVGVGKGHILQQYNPRTPTGARMYFCKKNVSFAKKVSLLLGLY